MVVLPLTAYFLRSSNLYLSGCSDITNRITSTSTCKEAICSSEYLFKFSITIFVFCWLMFDRVPFIQSDRYLLKCEYSVETIFERACNSTPQLFLSIQVLYPCSELLLFLPNTEYLNQKVHED